jgi:predicted metal-dependent phosphoesterase TrpH
MPLLKADLHIHTSEDPEDLVLYSATELVDMACGLGYSVLSITNHNRLTWSGYLRDYARERDIVLIPGMEATVQRRHVLLYNVDVQEVDRRSISRLRSLKGPQSLIMAPHPYFPSPVALRGLLGSNLDVFDAIELCHFYSRHVDFNRAAKDLAERHAIPMVGTSDAHQRRQFHTTYSLIDAEPDPEAVIQAIKAGRVRTVSRPLPLSLLVKIQLRMTWRNEILHRL